ncbi:MAG: hypothetical protein CL581_14795 [Alteromonadaceae bacterium]|nr:hypothetical protein [Alteromonadaceae bacterium]MBH86285.1 hypothetical protein [Alteromonadaceae bacterium]
MGFLNTGRFPLLLTGALVLAGCGGGGSSDGSTDNGGGDTDAPPASEFDLSGQIGIEARTRVDSDTAEDFSRGAATDNETSPQALPSPAIVAGYLSSNNGFYTSSAGFRFYRDQADSFRLALSENQVVTVQAFAINAAPGPAPSGSVELAPQNTSDIAQPLTPSTPVSVSARDGADNDIYDLTLRAVAGGPFRYVVSVSSAAQGTTFNVGYAQPDWVPNEAIITMDSSSRASSVLSAALPGVDRQLLAEGVWKMTRPGAGLKKFSSSASLSATEKQETMNWIQSLQSMAGVASAEPNYLYQSLAVQASNNPLYSRQWHYPLINLPTAWQALNNPGLGVRVAVLDTGMFSTTPDAGGNWHPDLEDSSNSNLEILSRSDFVTGDLDNDSSPGEDSNPANPGGDGMTPTSFHGTHVAGTIAALDNFSGGIGVAPMATVQPVRVLGRDGAGSTADIVRAIDYLAGLPVGGQRPEIINLSLGSAGLSRALEQSINRAVDAGILVVAAAGNEGTTQKFYPAAFDSVIGVGAVDGGRKRASYSNFGDWIDLVAPGGDASRDANSDGQADVVISAWGQQTSNQFLPGYVGLQGTSMAAPHVSGVIALMKERNPSLSHATFRELLRRGDLTDEVGNMTEYGYGLINALKAVDAASSGGLGAFLSASPDAFRFDGSVTQAEVELKVVPQGSNAIDINSIVVDESLSWLEVSKAAANDGVLLTARVTAASEARQAEITVNYNNGSPQTLTLPVNVQLGDPQGARNAGRHFVLLVDNETGATVAEAIVEAENGHYNFGFDVVPAGEYILVAGSDIDNNGFICEAGEACAEYPTNGLPQPIVKGSEALSGLLLTTSYTRPELEGQSLPRAGFEGYRLMDESEKSTPRRQSH